MAFVDVRAVVFDAVGTLIHPSPPAAVVYEAVGRRFGSRMNLMDIASRFKAAFQREEAADRATGFQTSEAREMERWRHIVSFVFHDISDTEECFGALFDHFGRADAWHSDPDAEELMAWLARRGYQISLASNFDRRLRTVVAGLPALRCVRDVVISSEGGWRKPAPEFFAAVCRILNISAPHIVYVGDDRKNDYDGASACGLRAVLFDPRREDSVPEMFKIARLEEIRQMLV